MHVSVKPFYTVIRRGFTLVCYVSGDEVEPELEQGGFLKKF